VNDSALLGVEHGEEVARFDARAFLRAGEVEELLRRGLARILRGAMEGSRRLVLRVYLGSVQEAAVV
jgi:hypothetical protein